ncbi:MAG TPA: hypothetical protein VHM02_09700 [Thermoanaerobaculia bacterium]|nr:hypothetical protein [Thermoanaerobaculia bacterium]
MTRRMLFVALLFLASAAPALAQEGCEEEPNTVVFDHRRGAVISPHPAVLALRDGDVFAVKFCNTLPSRFDYEISPIETAKEKEAKLDTEGPGTRIDELDLTETTVTWKHREEFALYQVHVTLQSGEKNPDVGPETESTEEGDRDAAPPGEPPLTPEAAPDVPPPPPPPPEEADEPEPSDDDQVFLYSYTFPIWVKTIDWDLRFTSGIAFSDLLDDRFFVETDDQGTEATDDDEKLVRRTRRDLGDSRPDVVAFVNLLTPDAGKWWGDKLAGGRLGLAFGFGIGESSEPRYFFGPSWTFGHNEYFVAMAGWTGGNVRRLPAAQGIDRAPISDNVLNELDSSFEHGFFAGLTFSFNRGDETKFVSGLNGKSGRTDTKEEKEDEE